MRLYIASLLPITYYNNYIMKNTKTICQFLGIKLERYIPFIIKHYGHEVYKEYDTGFWSRREYDENWYLSYHLNSKGHWFKYEHDVEGNETYKEDYMGNIEDNRPKELTLDEIAKKFGIPVTQLKIKKD